MTKRRQPRRTDPFPTLTPLTAGTTLVPSPALPNMYLLNPRPTPLIPPRTIRLGSLLWHPSPPEASTTSTASPPFASPPNLNLLANSSNSSSNLGASRRCSSSPPPAVPSTPCPPDWSASLLSLHHQQSSAPSTRQHSATALAATPPRLTLTLDHSTVPVEESEPTRSTASDEPAWVGRLTILQGFVSVSRRRRIPPTATCDLVQRRFRARTRRVPLPLGLERIETCWD